MPKWWWENKTLGHLIKSNLMRHWGMPLQQGNYVCCRYCWLEPPSAFTLCELTEIEISSMIWVRSHSIRLGKHYFHLKIVKSFVSLLKFMQLMFGIKQDILSGNVCGMQQRFVCSFSLTFEHYAIYNFDYKKTKLHHSVQSMIRIRCSCILLLCSIHLPTAAQAKLHYKF